MYIVVLKKKYYLIFFSFAKIKICLNNWIIHWHVSPGCKCWDILQFSAARSNPISTKKITTILFCIDIYVGVLPWKTKNTSMDASRAGGRGKIQPRRRLDCIYREKRVDPIFWPRFLVTRLWHEAENLPGVKIQKQYNSTWPRLLFVCPLSFFSSVTFPWGIFFCSGDAAINWING